jgi:hypothetical protein
MKIIDLNQHLPPSKQKKLGLTPSRIELRTREDVEAELRKLWHRLDETEQRLETTNKRMLELIAIIKTSV